MYMNKNPNQSAKFMQSDPPVRPIEIPCRYHTGSICLNYCHEISCFKLLCQECIEQHLDHHKKSGLPILSIKSFKKVRQFCVQKLNKLIQDLVGKISSLKQPKNPQQILEQANMKFEAIKKLMFEIIQQELSKFYEQLRIKVNQSFSTLKNLEEVHQNLSKIIMQLKQSKRIVLEGAKEIPETVQQVLAMNQNLYVDTFAREAAGYAQKLAYVDFDVSMNQNKFRNSVSESLRINRNDHDEVANNSGQFGMMSRLNANKTLGLNSNAINTPSNRSRIKQNSMEQSRDVVQIKLQSDMKFLHFFETNSSNLHLIDLSSSPNIHRQIIPLPNYIVPAFHASIMFVHGYIFISGGNLEIGDNQVKSDRLSKYSLKAKTGENFKKDFSKVKPRSSHSMCEYGDYLYILGGYGQVLQNDTIQSEKIVEKVNIRSGEVELQTRSRFGGANIAVAMNNCILKASEQGAQVYNIMTKKWTTIQVPQNYLFVRGCGWTRTSKDSLFVYGGYNDNQDGIDTCKNWFISENEIQIRNTNYKLPFKEGFLNNPGTIVNGNVYVLQSISIEESRQDSMSAVEESERSLLVFDGHLWKELAM